MPYSILIKLHLQISTFYWLKTIKDKLIPAQTMPEVEVNKGQALHFSVSPCKDQKPFCNQEWIKIV